jgi:hypothetical protein
LRNLWRTKTPPTAAPLQFLSRYVLTCSLLSPLASSAQEALRNQLALQAIKETRETVASSPYNLKLGEFRARLTPSVMTQWNNNVQLSEDNPNSDFVLRPMLELDAAYPISENNTMRFNISGGYQRYFRYEDLSSWYLQSGSELSFDAFIKSVRISLHEIPSYSLDAAQQSTVAETGNYGTFRNTSGLFVGLDIGSGQMGVGYDHLIVKSITDQFASQDLTAELVNALATVRLTETLSGGVEATATFASYDENVLNDHSSYSAGILSEWQPEGELRIQLRGGYTVFDIHQTSQSVQTSNLDSWYASLRISGKATDAVYYSLDGGHEIRTGLVSDLVATWYFRPGLNWRITRSVTVGSSLSYEHGKQGIGNISGNQVENFDWISFNGNVTWRAMERLSVALDYRLVLRSSDLESRSYHQGILGLVFTYETP